MAELTEQLPVERPCHVCGKPAIKICKDCGRPVCDECYLAYSESCPTCTP